jgi:hypothetical protein
LLNLFVKAGNDRPWGKLGRYCIDLARDQHVISKAKGPKHDSQNQLSSPMHDRREFACIV